MGGLTLDTDLYLSGGNLNFDDGSTVAVGPLVQSATIHLRRRLRRHCRTLAARR